MLYVIHFRIVLFIYTISKIWDWIVPRYWRVEDGWLIFCIVFICLSLCPYVILQFYNSFENFNLNHLHFKKYVQELWYNANEYSYGRKLWIKFLYILTFELTYFGSFNLANNLWIVSARLCYVTRMFLMKTPFHEYTHI